MRMEALSTEEAQPPGRVHRAEVPVSALQFRIRGPLRGWGDHPAREGGNIPPLVGDPDRWLAEWPPWRKQSRSRSRDVGKTGPGHPGFRSHRPPRRPCVLGQLATQISCIGTIVSSCPAWGLGCALGTVTLPRRRRTQVELPPRGGRCALGFQQGLLDTWVAFRADMGRGVWPAGQGSPLPTVWGPGLQSRGPEAFPRPSGKCPRPSPHSTRRLRHWTHSRGHHVTSRGFSRNASALLTVAGRSDADTSGALPRAAAVRSLTSPRAASLVAPGWGARPCVCLGS